MRTLKKMENLNKMENGGGTGWARWLQSSISPRIFRIFSIAHLEVLKKIENEHLEKMKNEGGSGWAGLAGLGGCNLLLV